MSTDLADRAAVVTGGGAGIGGAIALALGRAGAAVTVIDKVATRGERTVARIRESGGSADVIVLDAMDGEALADAVRAAGERWGRLDVLVNNVGGTTRRAFVSQSRRSWQRLIALNLLSALEATQAAVPIIIRGGRGGSIINVTSIEASRAAPGYAVYAACKAALENLTKTWALEFAEYGIRVNAIAPDHTASPGTRGMPPDDPGDPLPPLPAAQEAALRSFVPLGREGVPAECGELALFLASERSAYITGVTVAIDGGTSAAAGWFRRSDGVWILAEGFTDGTDAAAR